MLSGVCTLTKMSFPLVTICSRVQCGTVKGSSRVQCGAVKGSAV